MGNTLRSYHCPDQLGKEENKEAPEANRDPSVNTVPGKGLQ